MSSRKKKVNIAVTGAVARTSGITAGIGAAGPFGNYRAFHSTTRHSTTTMTPGRQPLKAVSSKRRS